MSWKRISKKEVMKMLKQDLRGKAGQLLKNKELMINSSMPHEITALSHELYKAYLKIKSKAVQPLFMGQAVGDTEDCRGARLSLQLSYEASKLKDLPKAYIKPKAEQLFLYGRDVISDSVIKSEGKIKKKGVIIVLNQEGEFLGLGFSRENLLGKGKTTVIKHVIDLGHYLRVEK